MLCYFPHFCFVSPFTTTTSTCISHQVSHQKLKRVETTFALNGSQQLQNECHQDKFSPSVISRRRVLFGLITNTILPSTLITNDANAIDSNTPGQQEYKADMRNKPYASNNEALLPAVRVKFTIDEAISIIHDYRNMTKTIHFDNKQQSQDMYYSTLDKLGYLLIQPQNYTKSLQLKGVPNQPAKQYLESYKPMSGDLPLQLYLIKYGDVNTWKNLKTKEKKLEQTDEILAAFNAYTDVLSYSGNSYLLNVDSKTKSDMIRQDKLPELKQVSTSDMGMRYLYRNQVLTAMDDAKAEMKYQLSLLSNNSGTKENDLDLTELLTLLREAQKACEKWFGLIGDKDVAEAILIVQNERQ